MVKTKDFIAEYNELLIEDNRVYYKNQKYLLPVPLKCLKLYDYQPARKLEFKITINPIIHYQLINRLDNTKEWLVGSKVVDLLYNSGVFRWV